MPTSALSVALQHLLADVRPDGDGRTDGELLARFVRSRDEDALAALVRRHAPMVWGVCRRLLGHHDAEDAFQATFLVLVHKAAGVPERAVANWLYGVARQTAVRVRATAAKRGRREAQVVDMPEPTVPDVRDSDLLAVLDEELSRLPDHYRAVVVLCDLEGMTRKEAARQLGIPDGSVASRLARARAMLAQRFNQRGFMLSGSVGAMLSGLAAASAPPALVASAIKVASLLAAGRAGGVVSVNVAALTEGVVKAMFVSKLKSVLAVLVVVLALGGIGVGVGLSIPMAAAQQPGGTAKGGRTQLAAAAAVLVGPAVADDPKGAKADDATVTVLYRGKTHTLTGKDAAAVRDAAVRHLRTSCKEVADVDRDAEFPTRYDRARTRSHVLVTFAKPIEVPKAGNNKVPVRVESLMVPFSPDLDPESVYVLPGRPFRMFKDFVPEASEELHAALVKAGVYPADAKAGDTTVTVQYRDKTHTLTGKDAAAVRDAAMDLLATACKEETVKSNSGVRARYDQAKSRSHVLVTFVKPVEVPNAGNNAVPVRVETLMVPFSPDLDPESVYVLPGEPFRAFRQFLPDGCRELRAVLGAAGVYPKDAK